jgi:cysteine-rich repeat protein
MIPEQWRARRRVRRPSVFFAAVFAASSFACGGSEPLSQNASLDEAPELEGVETSVKALAPPGSDAMLVSHTVPTIMGRNEQRTVTITIRNTGASSPANTWTPDYELRRSQANSFGFVTEHVTGNILVGETETFTFTLDAPNQTGPRNLYVQMRSDLQGQTGFFGPELIFTINVVNNAYDSEIVSASVPPAMVNNGGTGAVSITLRNIGSNAWTGSSFELRLLSSVPNANWGINSCGSLAANETVPVGGTRTFNCTLTAPNQPGTYTLSWQMRTTGGVGFFGAIYSSNVVVSAGFYGASVVSQNIPLVLAPGATATFQITMQNTGNLVWNGGTATFQLTSVNSPANLWGITIAGALAANEIIPVGGTRTFTFTVTAPTTPGTYTSAWRMRRQGTQFGATAITNGIQVTGTPITDAAVVSQTIPSIVQPSSTNTFTITMRNSGSTTWTGTNFRLVSVNNPANLWTTLVAGNLASNESILPGFTRTFTFSVTAPFAAGSYDSNWRMEELGGVGLFGDTATTLGITVPAIHDAQVVSQTIPSPIEAGFQATFSITMRNSGNAAWNTTNFRLSSVNNPVGLWTTLVAGALASGESVAPNGTRTFTFTVTAPSTAGEYDSEWSMEENGGIGFFGDIALTTFVIVERTDATVSSQNIPSRIVAGTQAQFSITMLNSGSPTASWDGPSFMLSSQNTPSGLWGVTSVPLNSGETIAPQSSRTFTFTVTAPATPGLYDSVWRMEANPGIGFFGQLASTTGIEVTLCGNNLLDEGEECDDGGWVNGDSCDLNCLREPMTIDLVNQASSRTIYGPATAAKLGKVAIGDITGDGTPDVAVAHIGSATPPGAPSRTRNGAVYVYSGASFLNNSTTQAPAGAFLTIYGARSEDQLGGEVASGLQIGDVTGDGTADLVVSAGVADCPSGALDCGRVYVIRGGMDLGTIGTIDLRTNATQVVARLVGGVAGDAARITAIGELNGDAASDLVLGLPFHDGGATDAGAVAIYYGGGSLTGTITITQATAAGFLLGAGAGDRLGHGAAIGNIGGTSAPDLILATGAYDAPGGVTDAGGAWAFFDTIAGRTLANADVRWIGAGARDGLGPQVAIGDVTGSGSPSVLIGVSGYRDGGQRYGAVEVWAISRFTPGPVTFDLAVDVPDIRIRGADVGDTAGHGLALADINGDGVMDPLIVSPTSAGFQNAYMQAGEIASVLGGSALGDRNLAARPGLLTAYGNGNVARLGLNGFAPAVGDLDGDGNDDYCVASPLGFANGLSSSGRVDCFSGGY